MQNANLKFSYWHCWRLKCSRMSHFATGQRVPYIFKGPSCFNLRGEAFGLFDPEGEDTVLQPASHGITPLKTWIFSYKGAYIWNCVPSNYVFWVKLPAWVNHISTYIFIMFLSSTMWQNHNMDPTHIHHLQLSSAMWPVAEGIELSFLHTVCSNQP